MTVILETARFPKYCQLPDSKLTDTWHGDSLTETLTCWTSQTVRLSVAAVLLAELISRCTRKSLDCNTPSWSLVDILICQKNFKISLWILSQNLCFSNHISKNFTYTRLSLFVVIMKHCRIYSTDFYLSVLCTLQ